MKKTKKALASLAIAGMVLSMAPMSVFAADATTRLSGADRVATAIAVATNGWATGSDNVIVVSADDANIVDALAAAPLAGQLNAPILVTYKDALDASVQQKIVDLKAKNVYAIGALSDATVASLKAIAGVTVEQLQGADRTETAAKVTAKLSKVNGSFVVAYEGKADALSAASFAAANGYSIVIANPDGTIPGTEKVVAPTYTVGGQVTVAGATPLKGADRYATNAEVVNGLTFSYDKVYVANGESLVDALAGAPLAAKTKSPIVLADAMQAVTAANDNLTASSQVIALGGIGAVSDAVLGKVAYQAPATLEVKSVSATNLTTIEVQFNKAPDEVTAEDEDNYTIEGNTVTTLGGKATLDGNTVTIELPYAARLTDDSYNKVVVSVGDSIEDTDTTKDNLDEYTTLLHVKDGVAPTVDSKKYVYATNEYTVEFSEMLSEIGTVTITDADGDVIDATLAPAFSAGDDKIVIDTAALTEDETYDVEIVGAKDLADNFFDGNKISFSFTTSKSDSVKPTIKKVEAVAKDELEVTFSEEIAILGQLNGNALVEDADLDHDYDVDHDGLVYTIKVPDMTEDHVYNYEFTLQQDNSANEIKDVNFNISWAKDETAPKVVKTTVNGKVVTLEFDENVAIGSTDAATLYTPDGYKKVVTNSAITLVDDKEVEVDLSSVVSTVVDGNYKLSLASGIIEDLADTPNSAKIEVTVDLNENDTTAPEVSVAPTYAPAHNGGKVTVKYTEDMGSSALVPSNYTVDGVAVFSSAYFTTDKKTVELSIKDGAFATTADRQFKISNVADKAGNKIEKAYTKTWEFADNTAPKILKAELGSDFRTITVTLSDIVDANSIVEGTPEVDFVVYVGDTKETGVVEAMTTPATNGKTFTLTLADALTATEFNKAIVIKPADDYLVTDASANANQVADFDSFTVSK